MSKKQFEIIKLSDRFSVIIDRETKIKIGDRCIISDKSKIVYIAKSGMFRHGIKVVATIGKKITRVPLIELMNEPPSDKFITLDNDILNSCLNIYKIQIKFKRHGISK